MPIKKQSKPYRNMSAPYTPRLESEPEYEEAPEPIPLPEEEPTTNEVPQLITFTRTTYYLNSGGYEGDIIDAKVYQSKDKPRLLLVFDLGNGLQFLHTLSIPIDRTTPVGKALYPYSDHACNTLIPNKLIGACAQFEVGNVDRNGCTYCNIIELELVMPGCDDDDSEDEEDEE